MAGFGGPGGRGRPGRAVLRLAAGTGRATGIDDLFEDRFQVFRNRPFGVIAANLAKVAVVDDVVAHAMRVAVRVFHWDASEAFD